MMMSQAGITKKLVGALVLVAVVTSCGGTSAKSSKKIAPVTSVIGGVVDQTSAESSNTAVTNGDACKLLSETDVSAAMKQPMKIADGAGSDLCIFTSPADPNVLIEVETFATRELAIVYSSPGPNSEHIDGLGDDAFWTPSLNMMYARKGEQSVIVKSAVPANLTGDPQAWKADMVALAKLVLANF
jgi:hypothetical protein